MSRNRTIKIWASLVACMTIGAIVLMTLDNKKVSAGAFSLSSFQRLTSISKSTAYNKSADKNNWQEIEVIFSDTAGGNIENIALAHGRIDGDDADFHFIIGNGQGAENGQIIATKIWKAQKSNANKDKIIILCVVGDGYMTMPTDSQTKRASALIEYLRRKFRISPKSIEYPTTWEL